MRRSITFLSSLKLGIPKRSSPPGASSLSNNVTLYPFRFNWFATTSPAGPAPITATLFPFLFGFCTCMYPSRKAASTIAASFSRIVTGWSHDSFSTQDFSQRAGQIRPVNSGKSQVDDRTSYASFHFPLNNASCHSGCLFPIGHAQWQKGTPQSIQREACNLRLFVFNVCST